MEVNRTEPARRKYIGTLEIESGQYEWDLATRVQSFFDPIELRIL